MFTFLRSVVSQAPSPCSGPILGGFLLILLYSRSLTHTLPHSCLLLLPSSLCHTTQSSATAHDAFFSFPPAFLLIPSFRWVSSACVERPPSPPLCFCDHFLIDRKKQILRFRMGKEIKNNPIKLNREICARKEKGSVCVCVCSHSCHPTFPPLRAADVCAADHKEGGEGFVLWDYLVRWICFHCVGMALPFGNKYYPALTYLQFCVPSRSLARSTCWSWRATL